MADNGRNQLWLLRPIRIPRSARLEADRRAGESLISLLSDADKAEAETLLERGEFVSAVRRVRELTGLRLIDARRLVEALRR
ncbi:MAG: hypothetical protein JO345_31455 [Streptosporangiaceae bacterium]|nr:hypothetical protein [Streptosporangiaceae bacterium]